MKLEKSKILIHESQLIILTEEQWSTLLKMFNTAIQSGQLKNEKHIYKSIGKKLSN